MPEELVVILKPPYTSGSQVCLGLAELLLPGWAVDPGVLLGHDAGEPAAVADEHRGDMAVGGHVDQLWKALARLGRGHLLDVVRQRQWVFAQALNVRHAVSVPSPGHARVSTAFPGFRRRPSAALRQGRSGSISPVSVAPRRRTAVHRCV